MQIVAQGALDQTRDTDFKLFFIVLTFGLLNLTHAI